VMLELGDEDLVARAQRSPQRFGQQVDAVGRAPREHDLLAAGGADEALDPIARGLVELGRLLAQRVDRAMDVGVAARVVLRHRLDHRARLLAGGRRIEVDERMAVDDPLEDRKVAAGLLVESHRPSACWSTEIGSVRQRRRLGRMSACSTARTSSTPSAAAAGAARPSTSSATTSAEAVQIAQESPAKRAAATLPSSTRTIIRPRSPQSGLTSSATPVAPASSPRKRGRRQRSRMVSL